MAPIPFILLLLFAPVVSSAAEARYTAVFADGSLLTGTSLKPWHESASRPKLDERDLFDSRNPVRWLLNGSLEAPPVPRAFVEFIGGDRIPGRIAAFGKGSESLLRVLPPYLLLESEVHLDWPDGPSRGGLRVVLSWVRRVVWSWRGVERYQPATVFFRDGSQIGFRSIRWSQGAVRLLLEEGTVEAPFSRIAELHLPRADPWEAYYRELSALCPEGGSLLMIETGGGLQATGSTERFRARSHGPEDDPGNWYHLFQPAWSLDPLWIPHRSIRLRRWFFSWEVPVSRIEPSRVLQDSPLGGSLSFRTDRSVQGGELICGGREYGWGLGVHARSEIEFEMPSCVRALRTSFGLDRSAGRGGCARAIVLEGAAGGKPLFRSQLLIGSSEAGGTGTLPLEPRPGGGRLVLLADPAIEDRPPLADPLDIRDDLDWLEPQVDLDPGELGEEVQRRAVRSIPAWQDWTAQGCGAPVQLTNRWDETDPGLPGYRLEAIPNLPYLKLSRRLTVAPDRNWLVVTVSRLAGQSAPARIHVRIDGTPAGEFLVPERNQGYQPDPILIPLRAYRGREVVIDVFQLQGSREARIEWRGLEPADLPPGLLRVFEDEPEVAERLKPEPAKGEDAAAGAPEAREAPEAAPSLERLDRYSGTSCLKVPRARSGFILGIEASIAEWPRPGEFRYLRFAWKKAGGERISLEVLRGGRDDRSLRYEAGPEPLRGKGAVALGEKPPDRWTVVTRDLHKDLGRSRLTGLALGCPDGEAALFDHIYLARTPQDLERIEEPEGAAQGK